MEFNTTWTLKMWTIVFPETSEINTIILLITTQVNEVVVYTATEAWIAASLFFCDVLMVRLIEILFKGNMQNGVLLEWFWQEKLKYQKKYILCVGNNFTIHRQHSAFRLWKPAICFTYENSTVRLESYTTNKWSVLFKEPCFFSYITVSLPTPRL